MAVQYDAALNLAEAARHAFDLSGHAVVVTGGAGILGRGFAAAMLAHGARAIVADIDEAAGRQVESELSRLYPGAVAFVPTDVRDEASVAALFARAQEIFGAVTGLVNNHTAPLTDAGAFFAPFERFSLSEWRRQMSISLDGVFLVAREAVRHMLAHGKGGSIVQTSSIYGVLGHDRRIYDGAEYRGVAINNPPSYAAAKAGVVGLTRWLAAEYADRGIRVNAIAPGGVFSGENDTFSKKYGDRVPMRRMAQQTEIFGSVLYLLSPASSYVTGQVLMIDGGLSAW
jgi:NAD(P)-dependent dehydrogenase (short-subunit alcohol dehydrogenase family)